MKLHFFLVNELKKYIAKIMPSEIAIPLMEFFSKPEKDVENSRRCFRGNTFIEIDNKNGKGIWILSVFIFSH